MPKTDDYERYHPKSRAQWRRWLERHYDKSPGVWLVYYKKATGKPRLSYDEAVEEALCFGWIDSLPRKLDEERSMQLYTPRNPKSGWSKLNKGRIARLIEEGLMTEAGLAKIAAAKRDGSWTKLDAVENLEMPADLARALKSNRAAADNFERFSPSVKKGLYWWVVSAKRAETRERRVREAVEKAARGRRAVFDKKE